MSLMSKLLTVATIATAVVSAQGVDKAALLKYVKGDLVRNPQVKVEDLEIIEKKQEKSLPGWDVYLTVMKLKFQGKELKIPETIFVNGDLVTGRLYNLKEGKQYRDLIRPNVPDSMYDDAHLLYGNKDATHKIIVFSDPMCPFCRQTVPGLLKAAKEHPDKIALYYYHLPLLQIHPVSGILTRIMHVAQKKGKKEALEKFYDLKIGFRETNTTKVLQAVQKHTGLSVSQEEIDAKEVKEAIKHDEDAASRLMVKGTPTIYIDGKWDKNRDGYKKLIK